jgi:hypothetical protein
METREKNRKDYKKPQVSQIKLEIEEAVLTGCKSAVDDATGKNGSGCDIPQCKRQPFAS